MKTVSAEKSTCVLHQTARLGNGLVGRGRRPTALAPLVAQTLRRLQVLVQQQRPAAARQLQRREYL